MWRCNGVSGGPGRWFVVGLPGGWGVATATTGSARSSVHSVSRALANLRVAMPWITMTAATAAAAIAVTRSPRRDRIGCAGSGDIRVSERCGVQLSFASVHEAEDDRHEHQCCDGWKDEATDDRASERGILLAAFPKAERHRGHADDHCKHGHY